MFKIFTKHHQPAVMTIRGPEPQQRLFFYDRTWRQHETHSSGWGAAARSGDRGDLDAALAYLRTGLPAVMPPYEIDPVEGGAAAGAVPVGYLVVDKLEFLDVGRRYAMPVVERDAGPVAAGVRRRRERALGSMGGPEKNTSPPLGSK